MSNCLSTDKNRPHGKKKSHNVDQPKVLRLWSGQAMVCVKDDHRVGHVAAEEYRRCGERCMAPGLTDQVRYARVRSPILASKIS